MAVIGIERLYYSKVLSDTNSGATFGTPIYLPDVQEIKISPKTSTAKLYAGNILNTQITTLSDIEVSIDLANLTNAQTADLLGQTIATEGGVISKSTDVAPYVALLFVANKSDGYKRYGVLYKGKFDLNDDAAKGQEGKVDFQTAGLKSIFQPLMYNKAWKYFVDSNDANCPADIDTTWFNAVVMPGADTTPPTVITLPLDAATAVAVSANIVWTFNKAIDTTKVKSSNFFLIKATDGTLVPGALTVNGTGTVVTLDPTTNLTAATAYIATCTTNVTDMAGNALASNIITNFTTA